MIKARGDVNGVPLVFLGLSAQNITRLVAGEPIVVNMDTLGLAETRVVIMYGRTERHIAAELERHEYLPPGFASDMPEPRPERGSQ